MKTKNIALSVIIGMIILSASVAEAQIKFGVRAGLNASNVSYANLPNRSERYGFHAGVFAEIPVSPEFITIQPEVSYSVKGVAFKPINDRITLTMNYIDLFVPVAFKLSSIDLQVGPFASYLVSTPNYSVFNDNRVIVDAFNKFDAGLTAGLSYNLDKLLFGVRYNQGFIDVTKDNARPVLGTGKNAVGQVSLGYKF